MITSEQAKIEKESKQTKPKEKTISLTIEELEGYENDCAD